MVPLQIMRAHAPLGAKLGAIRCGLVWTVVDAAWRSTDQKVGEEGHPCSKLVRERELKVAEERVRKQNERLRLWEDELEAREQGTEMASKLGPWPGAIDPKTGRNERCPCGSGLKYKRCHGPLRT
jgi:hypothetical protein